MPRLDLIVTHYNEPLKIGYKLFGMLGLQRGVSADDFRVILVQDGPFDADWTRLSGFSYAVDAIQIDHGGVSAARNAGLHAATSEWVMFVDFDDTFSSVFSLKRYLDAMSDDYDMICSRLYVEQYESGRVKLDPRGDNDTYIHGKMFRREWFENCGLEFNTNVTYSEDSLFCNVMRMCLNPSRVYEIPSLLYVHCWREGSVCRDKGNNLKNAVGLFNARKALTMEYYNRGREKNYGGTVVKTVFDYYYALKSEGYPAPEYFERDFFDYWQRHKNAFRSVDRNIFALKKKQSFDEAADKGFTLTESIPVWEWIERMERKYGTRKPDTEPADTLYPRVAVYHGTRNTYRSMLCAAKSLIVHTNVEKIYFLIEDDVFPEELPDMIETINLSGQQYILPTSPNYHCCWTWMVMLRAAFPKIFPQYDAVLSLDIDTIVDRNIDDVWNTDLSDAYYAAVREYKKPGPQIYTNMGVCLLNLRKLRDDGMCDRILNELNTVYHQFTEQDVFNTLCAGHVISLPSCYNICEYTEPTDDERILHFAGYVTCEPFAIVSRYASTSWDDIEYITGKHFHFPEVAE